MSQLLVKVRKAKWLKSAPQFVPQDDVRADCLVDLGTKEDTLSVWAIEDDDSNLERVLTALAANCHDIANIDYLLFDESIPVRFEILVRQTPGGTADAYANERWHRDLIELTGKKLLAFACTLRIEGKLDRRLKKQIRELAVAAVKRNEIDLGAVTDGVLESVKAGPLSVPTRLRRWWRDIAKASTRAWNEYRSN